MKSCKRSFRPMTTPDPRSGRVLFVLSGCSTVRPEPERACFHLNQAIEVDIGYRQALRVGNTLSLQ